MEVLEREERKYVLDKETSKGITTVAKANMEILRIKSDRALNNMFVGTGAIATVLTANMDLGTVGVIGAGAIGTLTLGLLGYQIYSKKRDKAKIEEIKEIKEDLRLAEQNKNNDYIRIVK